MFFYGKVVIPVHFLSSKSRNSTVFTYSDSEITLSFAITGNIAVTLHDVRMSENRNYIFQCEKINQLALSLKHNSKIAVGKFIFHYTINSSANFKRRPTQIC